MKTQFPLNALALACVGALSLSALTVASGNARASDKDAGKKRGTYLAGDFHNHTTCSDGSSSMQKLVKKSMDRDAATPWGLDWFVQAGHGGNGNRNCTLVEDASLATPAYPYVTGATPFDVLSTNPANASPTQYRGPNTTWAQSVGVAAIKGDVSNGGGTRNMHRWQTLQSYQYPLMEYLSALRNEPLWLGLEQNVPGHEHTSAGVVTGQLPASTYNTQLPQGPNVVPPNAIPNGYAALGNANALAEWTYCFERGATADNSRGAENQWNCAFPGGVNNGSADWNDTAKRLTGGSGGTVGHAKTLESVKWMAAKHPNAGYYVPAHLERAGPFNPAGNNGFNVEHLRNMNNAASSVAFGFESQPGHGASDRRGEYNLRRNAIGATRFDSVGGTTYGGTGVYAGQVGGVWDALLGEGRNWWFFASSDWHSRGAFGNDDRRSDNDFFPGEYQRNYTMVRNDRQRVNPQTVVDGLRSGNNWVDSGQLIDRLSFVACVGNGAPHGRSEAAVEALAVNAASDNTDVDKKGCVTMGEKLVVPPGADVVVSIVVRDPDGKSYSPYSFPNPSLAQINIDQPMDAPVLDHVDVIRGLVTGFKSPANLASYAGAWPDDWVDRANPQQLRSLASVPAAAKNETAAVYKTFNAKTWSTNPGKSEFKRMTFRIKGVADSQYLRLRGTNLPPSVPFETDPSGNPLSDLWTNTGSIQAKNSSAVEFPTNNFLRIPCRTVGNNVPDNATVYTGVNQPKIDGCPNHLPTVTIPAEGSRPAYTGKAVGFDVAAWADLWFYSNPIFIEVSGRTPVAGVQ